jgi:hypothetical protein
MTINKLASLIAKKEGKKTQARIGEVREILGILSDMIYEGAEPICVSLYNNGEKRAKKKKKVRK